MGAGQSTSQNQPPARGLHVLRVTPSSPASYSNIEPFFDFIVGFEGDTLSSEKDINVSELERIVESHENRTLNLLVWNSKNQVTRVVSITPSRTWSQQHMGPTESAKSSLQPSLLGLSMRMCQPDTATDNVWHVLDVIEGSPAESAGLVPMGDWILGWSGGVLSAENDFYELVEAHVDKPLRVYVYSFDFDNLREVVLIPNRHWGGEGLLGCVFGFGLLHRIPPQPEDRMPGTVPDELQEYQDEYEAHDLFIPADSQEHHPSQLAEWRRQEQEQWNRANNAHARPAQGHHHSHGHDHDHHSGEHHHHHSDHEDSSPEASPVGRSMNGNASKRR